MGANEGVGKTMYEQLSLFDFMYDSKPEISHPNKILNIGDKIGRVVLGECRVATITKVEGLPDYPFYRTDSGGCYSIKEGERSIDELLSIAEENREKYKTIIPKNLSQLFAVEYEPRECDGVVLWAQIGILDNMLFWKENVTYQFLEPYESEKKLMKAYKEHKKRIIEDGHGKIKILETEHEMRRLYWSNKGFYADAEYKETNG